MAKPFCYDRREGYFAEQDIAPDHRFALMRWSGEPTTLDDRKRQKKGHRHVA